jgi:hypothetical protein
MSNENNYMLLYELRNKEPYRETSSWCLPSDFVADELLMHKTFVNDQPIIVKEKPFILAGPEFNTFK